MDELKHARTAIMSQNNWIGGEPAIILDKKDILTTPDQAVVIIRADTLIEIARKFVESANEVKVQRLR